MQTSELRGAEGPITIAIAATGGHGGGVLSSWIVDMAEHHGYVAQATSVPGVAQRTGATIYYIELFPRAAMEAAGLAPVLSLMPIPGQVDVLIAAEWMEAGRALLRGLATKERTLLIASSHREYAVSEKSAMGDGRADGDLLHKALEAQSRRLIAFDMDALAVRAESVISSVLFGALAGAGALPFESEAFEETIRRSAIAVENNLAGFIAGLEGVGGRGTVPAPEPSSERPEERQARLEPSTHPRAQRLGERIDASYPASLRSWIRRGVERVVDFQDLRYGDEFLDRLDPIRRLDERAGGGPDESFELTKEAARHLALWMSFEDAIRVADLKTRADRFRRIREEAWADAGQPVYVVEFLHPGVEEIRDIVPAGLGAWIEGSGRARRMLERILGDGRKVQSAKIGGYLMLRAISGLRRFRRASFRFQRESALIEEWLQRVARAAEASRELALGIVKCQGLIKGYGDTHANGMKNYRAVLRAIDGMPPGEGAASTLRRLTEAALSDEDGAELDRVLGEGVLAGAETAPGDAGSASQARSLREPRAAD